MAEEKLTARQVTAKVRKHIARGCYVIDTKLRNRFRVYGVRSRGGWPQGYNGGRWVAIPLEALFVDSCDKYVAEWSGIPPKRSS